MRICDVQALVLNGTFIVCWDETLLRNSPPRGRLTIDANALVLRAYIDNEFGLSFKFACYAMLQDEQVTLFADDSGLGSFTIRIDESTDYSFIWLPHGVYNEDTLNLDRMVRECYQVNDFVQYSRTMDVLHPLRDRIQPDVIRVLLSAKDGEMEGVWCRIHDYINERMVVKLLHDTKRDFGLRTNALLNVDIVQHEGQAYVVWEQE